MAESSLAKNSTPRLMIELSGDKCGQTAPPTTSTHSQSRVNQLEDVREKFVRLVTEANIKVLLDKLQHPLEGRRFINKLEAEEVIQNPNRTDKARSLIDMVISKGDAACEMMLTTLHDLDHYFLNTPAPAFTSQRVLGFSSKMPPLQGFPPELSLVTGAERMTNETKTTVINNNYTVMPPAMPSYQTHTNLKRKAESIGIWTAGSIVNNAKRPKIEDHLVKDLKIAPKAPAAKKPVPKTPADKKPAATTPAAKTEVKTPAAVKQPKVKKPAAAKEPKVKKPAAAKEPKVKKPAAAQEPKVKNPAAVKQPKVKKPTAAKEPKVKKPAAAKEPKVKKPAAAKEPKVKKPAAAKEPKVKKPAASKEPKVKKPAAAKEPKVKKPAAAKEPKVKKPVAAKKPKVKKPAAAKKPNVKKPAAAKTKVKKPAAKKCAAKKVK